MFELLKKFIQDNCEEIIITGGVDDLMVQNVEKCLKVSLNQEYKLFLKTYGMILGFGERFLGCGKNETMPVVEETESFRQYGLPNNMIVISNLDEYIYCLDLLTGNVISWDMGSKKAVYEDSSFGAFLYNTLVEAKEDWE